MNPKKQSEFDRQLFSVREAAEHLRVSRTTIFRLLREGKLAPTKIGTRTLISGAAITHLLDKRGTTDALEIGALLLEAKAQLAAEGEGFTNWLHLEFAWSHRTADRFMRARKWYDSQNADTRHCVESSLTVTALYVLSAEEVPAKARREILKLAKEQRVGGTTARKIVAEARAEAEDKAPSGEPEGPAARPALDLVKAIETLLCCDPAGQNLEGLSAPELIRAAEILTALARRMRGDDAVKLAADRAEARSAMGVVRTASIVPTVGDCGDTKPVQHCPIDHSAAGTVPIFLCRSGLSHETL